MADEIDPDYEEAIKKLAIRVSGIAMKLSVGLFIILFLYVFIPFDMVMGSNTTTPVFDSIRIETKKDTIQSDSARKIYQQVETKSVRTEKAPSTVVYASVSDKMEAAYKYFILLFAVMLATILVPRIKSIKATKDGIDIDTFEKSARNKREEENVVPAPRDKVDVETKRDIRSIVNKKDENELAETDILTYASDPQKGKWGGQDERNFRKVFAMIRQSAVNKELFDVNIKVISTDPNNHPLTGSVVFHLHPTFANQTPEIYVINGIAELKLKAWGAFTLGVVADKGLTKLELDLALLHDAPEVFKSR